jgi:predicted DNA-binding transcriptional regulator AlpA
MPTGTSDTSAAPRVENTLLTETQAAELLSHSVRTIQGWRLSGGGPPFIKMGGRSVRYRVCDIERWLEERRRSSTSDPGSSASQERS